jgi:lysophospholipase L1-like esterase
MHRYIHQPGAIVKVRTDPASMPGIFRDSSYRINNLGIRGRLPARTDGVRILAIGGSTVEENALNDEDTWCGRLERHLGPGAWVGNAGKSGMRLRHGLLHLRELMPHLHLTCVLVLCGLNDMLADFGLHMNRTGAPDDNDATAFGWVETSDVRRHEPTDIDLGATIAKLKTRYRLVNAEDFVGADPLPQILEASLLRYGATVREIAAFCKGHGARVVFLTQPTLWMDPPGDEAMTHYYAGGVGPVEDWFKNPRHPYFPPPLLRRLIGEYNAELRVICELHGLRGVDLAGWTPAWSVNFYDDFHFSMAGAKRAAEIVAMALLPPPTTIYPVW